LHKSGNTGFVRASKYYHTFSLPDGGKTEISDDKPYGVMRIDKKGSLIRVLINGQLAVSGSVAGYGPIVRFEADVFKSKRESLWFTDFHVTEK